MSTFNKEEAIKRFENLLLSTKREGIEKLIDEIRNSDFYTAPASTKYHSSCESGLLYHSLCVYDCLMSKFNNPLWKESLKDVGDDSLIISSLLHDTCKAFGFYVSEVKNKKVYSENGNKIDSQGRYSWESYMGYSINNSAHPLGHGAGSVIMLQSFIKLKPVEIYSILHHMSFSQPKELYGDVGESMKKYSLVLALSQADMDATYLLEADGEIPTR